MKKGLPNIYALGMPKSCGTSLNKWFSDNTRWSVVEHDATDIVEVTFKGSEDQRIALQRERAQKTNTGECRTGMMHLYWQDIAKLDPNALFIMNVRPRVEKWAGSFWRHFSRNQRYNKDPQHRNASRQILHIPSNSDDPKIMTQIDKPGLIKLMPEYMESQFQLAEWVANNPNACVVSIDGGTTPTSLIRWLHERVTAQGDGSAVTWGRLVNSETSVGNPVYAERWPRSRVAPAYEIPLWIVVECMDWNSRWITDVMSQTL